MAKLRKGEVVLQVIGNEDWFRAIRRSVLYDMARDHIPRIGILLHSREFPIYCTSQVDYSVVGGDDDSWDELLEQLKEENTEEEQAIASHLEYDRGR